MNLCIEDYSKMRYTRGLEAGDEKIYNNVLRNIYYEEGLIGKDTNLTMSAALKKICVLAYKNIVGKISHLNHIVSEYSNVSIESNGKWLEQYKGEFKT